MSVFDANKKVLYVDKGSKCVARAIMRLTKMSDTAVNKTLSFRDVAEDAAMESGSDEKLVIFLERMYFSHLTNAEIIQVRKLLYDLAEAKATALGAKILVAQDYEDIAEEKLLKKLQQMFISPNPKTETSIWILWVATVRKAATM